jgi:2-C-methyl-D-erythritol 4-phosphate cytidylyltransferase / 2-C-methyl-D-erythritol 2,4-cyclodiphosphate synthase
MISPAGTESAIAEKLCVISDLHKFYAEAFKICHVIVTRTTFAYQMGRSIRIARTMTTAIIIVAAGRGSRAGGDRPKQWQTLAGRSVLSHTIGAFATYGRVVVVIHPDDRAEAETLCADSRARHPGCDVTLVPGGETRADSVRNALETLANEPAPALSVTDALWRGRDGTVAGTQSRDGLFRAQTPQAFRFDPSCRPTAPIRGGAADDVEVARAAGLDVTIVEGDEDNLKLTWPGDFARAEAILKGRKHGCPLGQRV